MKKILGLIIVVLNFGMLADLFPQVGPVLPTTIGRVYVEDNHLFIEGDDDQVPLTGDQLVGALYNSSFDGRYVLFGGAKKEADLLLPDLALYVLDLETKAITNLGQKYSIPVVAGAFSPNTSDLALVDGKGRVYLVRYEEPEVKSSIMILDDGEDVGLACIWDQSGRNIAVPKISLDLEGTLPRTWAIINVGASEIRLSRIVRELSELPDFKIDPAEHELAPDSCAPVSGTVTDLTLRLPWPGYHGSAGCGTVNTAVGQYSVSQAYCGSSHNGWQLDFRLPSSSPVVATAAGTVSAFANFTGNTCNADCSSCTPNNGTYVKLWHQGTAGNQWYSWYLHLTPPLSAKASTQGASFASGEFIACSDSTGSACGAHLHFEMKKTDLTPVRPVPMRGVELSPDTYPITDFSVNKTYQAPLASPAPSPIAPPNNGTNQSTTPTFTWPSVPGATSYRIVVGTTASALDVLDDPTSAGPSVGSQGVVINSTPTTNSFSPSTPLGAGVTYYWRVKGRGSAYGDASARFQFTTSGGSTSTDLAKSTDNLNNLRPYPGDSITASIVTKNQACSGTNANAGAFHIGFYWSTSSTFSGVTPFHEAAINGCAANSTVSLNQGITIGSSTPPGTYYLGYKIDDQSEVSDCDRSNNGIWYWTITVQEEGGSTSPAKNDLNGDGKSDLIWQNANTGQVVLWFMDGQGNEQSGKNVQNGASFSGWNVMGAGDLNSDGRSDVLWQNTSNGQVYVWFMDGQGNQQGGRYLQNGATFPGWNVNPAGDLNNDGKSDIMWQNASNGQVYIWFMDGQGNQQGGRYIQNGATFPGWNVMAAGDLNGDGKADILWQNASNGQAYIWFMDGQGNQQGGRYIQNGATFPGWNVIAAGDLNSDGKSDLIWQNASSGQAYIWFMDGQGNQQGGRYVQGGSNFGDWKIKP